MAELTLCIYEARLSPQGDEALHNYKINSKSDTICVVKYHGKTICETAPALLTTPTKDPNEPVWNYKCELPLESTFLGQRERENQRPFFFESLTLELCDVSRGGRAPEKIGKLEYLCLILWSYPMQPHDRINKLHRDSIQMRHLHQRMNLVIFQRPCLNIHLHIHPHLRLLLCLPLPQTKPYHIPSLCKPSGIR